MSRRTVPGTRFHELLEEADGDLRQYVQDVLLEAWAQRERSEEVWRRIRRRNRIAFAFSCGTLLVVLASFVERHWL